MSSQAPPPSSPAGVPSSGNGKYVAITVVLFGLIGAVIVWRPWQKPPPPPVVVVVDAGPPATVATGGRNLDDEIPLPPPVPEAGPEPVKKAAARPTINSQCDVKQCSGSAGPELEKALQLRVRQAHRCYDTALEQDATLRGKVTLAVRVGANGQVCSARVASNEMGSSQVASCVTGFFRGASFPLPKGGCIDANIPINFIPRQ